MRDVFKIEVRRDRLITSLDMLRHDCAYRVEYGDIVTIWSMFYTPKRWESFGVRTKLIEVQKIKNKDFDKLEIVDIKDVEEDLKKLMSDKEKKDNWFLFPLKE